MTSERNLTIPKFPKSLFSKSSRSSPLQFESKKHRNSKSTVTLPALQNTKPKKIQIQTPSDSKSQILPSSPFKTQNSKGLFFLDGGEDFNVEEDFQKEYSCIENQIVIIRKKHDKTTEEIKQSQLLLSKLQNQLENFNFTEKQVNASQQLTQQSSESLKSKICELKDTYEEQMHLKNVYEHMYDRVKKEKIFFENKSKIISKKKDLQEYFLGIKSDKKRRQKEKKSQSLVSLKKVKQLLYVKRMQKENIIKQLELNLFERSQNKERRDLRIKNQTESIKKAMTDDKVSDEAQLKQKMLINRFYCILIDKKYKLANDKFRETENAFNIIKVTTGTVKTEDFIQKFLQRSEIEDQLKYLIQRSEVRLQQLEEENQKMNQKLNIIQLADNEHNTKRRALIELQSQVQQKKSQLSKASELSSRTTQT